MNIDDRAVTFRAGTARGVGAGLGGGVAGFGCGFGGGGGGSRLDADSLSDELIAILFFL